MSSIAVRKINFTTVARIMVRHQNRIVTYWKRILRVNLASSRPWGVSISFGKDGNYGSWSIAVFCGVMREHRFFSLSGHVRYLEHDHVRGGGMVCCIIQTGSCTGIRSTSRRIFAFINIKKRGSPFSCSQAAARTDQTQSRYSASISLKLRRPESRIGSIP